MAGCQPDSPRFHKIEDDLRTALSPTYSELFRRMGQQTDGVKFLVDLRATLIDCIKSIYGTEMTMSDKERMTATLKTMNNHLKSLLAHWFSVGFLTLEQITWNSSCSMLQRVSDYEAGKCDFRYFQTTLLILILAHCYFKTDNNITINYLFSASAT